jgi:dihydroneopterin aldolase
MYTIFVRGLIIEGIHGVTHKEKERRQPFQIDIIVETDIPPPKDDQVNGVLDYRVIRKIATRIVAEESHELVETIALRIIEEAKRDPRAVRVTVSVTKLSIWDKAMPGVTIAL